MSDVGEDEDLNRARENNDKSFFFSEDKTAKFS